MNGYRKEGREEGEEGRKGGTEEERKGREEGRGLLQTHPLLQALKPPLSSNNTYIYTIPCTLIA